MGSIIFLAALLGIMYFIMIRPQQRQMKAHAALIRSLEEGMVVVTNSGIQGAIAAVEDKAKMANVEAQILAFSMDILLNPMDRAARPCALSRQIC